jgi:hypothetical protein
MPLAGVREAFYAQLVTMTPGAWKNEMRDMWERLEAATSAASERGI